MLVFINLLYVLVWVSLGLSFLWFTLFLVGFYLLFTGSYLSPHLWNFQPSLLPSLFAPLFPQFQKHNLRTFLLEPQWSLRLCHFFCYSESVISIHLQVPRLFSLYSSLCCRAHPLRFLFQVFLTFGWFYFIYFMSL